MFERSKGTKLNLEDVEKVTGGTDYSYAMQVLGEICTRFKGLIDEGVPPADARAQVREQYWSQVLDICAQHPDDCSAEKQAQVIFMFVIGS